MAPGDKTTVETASSCPPCTGLSEYSDEAGLKKCKSCPAGHFGVEEVQILSRRSLRNAKAEGPHTTCDDNTCEKPTELPSNSVVVDDECPDRGKHTGTPDTCTLTCKPGFYSSASNRPCTCAIDGIIAWLKEIHISVQTCVTSLLQYLQLCRTGCSPRQANACGALDKV